MTAKQRYADYLKTDYWKEVTKQVKERAGWKCQVCNSPHDLQAHHRTYDHRGNELNHLSDLICMCRRCHGVFHGAHVAMTENAAISKGLAKRERPDLRPTQELMPEGSGPFVLTRDMVHLAETRNGGFTTATARAFGVKFKKGWASSLIGKTITRDQLFEAIEGRFKLKKGKSGKIQSVIEKIDA